MSAKLYIFAGMTALGVVFAAHANSRERQAAIQVSAVLSAVWLGYAMPWIYEPASIAGALYRAGFHAIQHEHTWPALDAIGCMATLSIAQRYWWGWAVWAAFIGMLCCHVAYNVLNWIGAPLEFENYTGGLDAAYIAQLAVLLFIGEGGVRNRVSRGLSRLRHAARPRLSAHLEG